MAISAAFANPLGNALDFDSVGRAIERVAVTGATGAAGNTAAYSPRFLKTITNIMGAFTFSAISGGSTTLTALDALGNGVTEVILIGTLV